MKKFAFAAALALSIGAAHAAEPDWAASAGLDHAGAGVAGDCYLDNSSQACTGLQGAASGVPALQAGSAPSAMPASSSGTILAGHPADARPASVDPLAFITNISMSTVPEPEVFAMMLLGLCLIGFRASRDSDEKFK